MHEHLACSDVVLFAVQGKEADVVLFSCVRAHDDGSSGKRGRGVGFLADVRRMNVGFTRARCQKLFFFQNLTQKPQKQAIYPSGENIFCLAQMAQTCWLVCLQALTARATFPRILCSGLVHFTISPGCPPYISAVYTYIYQLYIHIYIYISAA